MIFRSKALPLIKVAIITFGSIIVALVVASSITIYSGYKLNNKLAQRSESIILKSLQNGGLPFAVAAQDIDEVEAILERNLTFEEIFAIEVTDTEGKLIARRERKLNEAVNIIATTVDITPFGSVALDELEEPDDNDNQTSLGTITVYFSTFGTYNTIRQQANFVGITLLISITLIALILFLFNRRISRNIHDSIKAIKLIEGGELVQSSGVNTPNISELKQIYSSLCGLSNTLYDKNNKLNQSLEDALKAKIAAQCAEDFKDDFIRAISHDIRTPVGVIVNLLRLINDECEAIKLGSNMAQNIKVCHASAKILENITLDLFNLEQFERNELIERKTKTDLQDLFGKFNDMYLSKFEDKGIVFDISNNCESSIKPSRLVSIDTGKITLILENVIDNALKYTQRGSVVVTWKTDSNSLIISIKDSGIGILEDKKDLIFERHTQLENPVTYPHEGRGLGLFYVSRLTKVLNGSISVESKRGIGSVFNLSFPYDDIVIPPLEVLSNSKDTSTLNVLVIDDDEDTCYTIGQMLLKYGIICDVESTPETGLSKLLQNPPDLVFIDYHMPDLSGDELARTAMSSIGASATFFVCITAEHNANSLNMLNELFHEVLTKPFDPQKLDSILRNVAYSKQIARAAIEGLN